MASITIRHLDDELKARLRVRAARQGRSMEDEARTILRIALAEEGAAPTNLAAAIRRRFAPLRGVILEVLPREPMREPPALARPEDGPRRRPGPVGRRRKAEGRNR